MNAPQEIYSARRQLDRISEVKITQDVIWDEITEVFFLEFSITLKNKSQYIETTTVWVLVLSEKYPEGEVRIYPSIRGGIETTYPHQECNNFIAKSQKWRSGKLCLSHPLSAIDKNYKIEPMTAEKRLLWNVQRTVQWVNNAAVNSLLRANNFFEIPEFFSQKEALEHKKVIVLEDDVSFMQWEDAPCSCGLAEIGLLSKKDKLWAVRKFMTANPNESVYLPYWGKGMFFETNAVALWMLLPQMPVVCHWQVPKTYDLLRSVCNAQGINLFLELMPYARKLRDGLPHVILLGYKIPNRVGEERTRVTWQALELPVLSFGKNTAKGYRPAEKGYLENDRQTLFTKNREIVWIKTENWESTSITSRGHLADNLLSKSILIIGAGCIGAATAELLARSGCRNLTIVDCDNLQIGNLCRHTLTMESVASAKSTALAQRLNAIGPHMNVESVNKFLKKEYLTAPRKASSLSFEKYDVIFECTGADDVLQMFNGIKNRRKSVFASISIDLGARCLYVNMQNGKLIDTISVMSNINNLQKESSSDFMEVEKLPRDGIGCWHPLFPARSDEIWMAASTAFGAFETFSTHEKCNNILCVYTKQEGYACGYQLSKKQEL